jgi:hypothetical protein
MASDVSVIFECRHCHVRGARPESINHTAWREHPDDPADYDLERIESPARGPWSPTGFFGPPRDAEPPPSP